MRSVAELGLFGDSVSNPGLIPSVLPFQLTNEPSSYGGFDFQATYKEPLIASTESGGDFKLSNIVRCLTRS